MKPIPETLLDRLLPVFRQMVDYAHTAGRTTAEGSLQNVRDGYKTRTMDAYADDPENPKHVLILGKYPAISTTEKLVVVNFIWSTPEERGKPEAIAAFKEILFNYADIFGADAILASSWKYKGSRPIDAFWVSLGFERQETVFVKLKGEGFAAKPIAP